MAFPAQCGLRATKWPSRQNSIAQCEFFLHRRGVAVSQLLVPVNAQLLKIKNAYSTFPLALAQITLYLHCPFNVSTSIRSNHTTSALLSKQSNFSGITAKSADDCYSPPHYIHTDELDAANMLETKLTPFLTKLIIPEAKCGNISAQSNMADLYI